MPQQLFDDNGVTNFKDDNGVTLFFDDLGNWLGTLVISPTGLNPKGRYGGWYIQHV